VNEQDIELLSAYLDGELSDSEREQLEQRLQAEPDLRRELESLRQLVALVRTVPMLKAPRDFTLTPAMVGQTPTRRTLSLAPYITLLSAAAAFVLIAVGALSLLNMSSQALPVPLASEAMIASMPTAQLEEQFATDGETETSAAEARNALATIGVGQGGAAASDAVLAEAAALPTTTAPFTPAMLTVTPALGLVGNAAGGEVAPAPMLAQQSQPSPDPAQSETFATGAFASTSVAQAPTIPTVTALPSQPPPSTTLAVMPTLLPPAAPPPAPPPPPSDQTPQASPSIPIGVWLIAAGIVLLMATLIRSLLQRRK
jgi:anti-sigma factor RsiW